MSLVLEARYGKTQIVRSVFQETSGFLIGHIVVDLYAERSPPLKQFLISHVQMSVYFDLACSKDGLQICLTGRYIIIETLNFYFSRYDDRYHCFDYMNIRLDDYYSPNVSYDRCHATNTLDMGDFRR